MRSLPLVSVLMPVYNGQGTIRLAIKSLLYQTYKNWECIIINDGSDDGTEFIIRDYKEDNRFKIISLPKNLGRGAARQIGLENAEGDYIAYLDADDLYHPRKLEIQVEYLEANQEVSLVSCRQGSFDEGYILKSVRGMGRNHTILFNPGKGLSGSHAGSMIRISDGRSVRYNLNLRASEDRDYFGRLLDQRRYCVLEKVLYYYYEIGNVTSKKILTYQYGALLYEFKYLKCTFWVKVRLIYQRILKILVYYIILPVFGPRKVVLTRGAKPLDDEIIEFQQVLCLLKSDSLYQIDC